MKTIILFLALVMAVSGIAQEQLNNQSLIDPQEMGFGKEVIIAKINNSPGQYDTSIEALLELKKHDIPSEVIAAMINNSKTEVETGVFIQPLMEIESR